MMSLVVRIHINDGEPVVVRSCRRTYPLWEVGISPDIICTYQTDRGDTITHRYGDGPEALARKLLNAPGEEATNA